MNTRPDIHLINRDLYANGSVPDSDQPNRVGPGRSPVQLSHVLAALAAVTEIPTSTDESA